MPTTIIAGFPGVGKSYYNNLHKLTSLDSDSSSFSWIEEEGIKKRNPDFPQNYINHIKENIGRYEFIFVSTHAEVRNALRDNCLFFYLLYPERSAKAKFLQRYIDRGSPMAFLELLDNNWNKWIDECMYYTYKGCIRICMDGGICDTIRNIISHV